MTTTLNNLQPATGSEITFDATKIFAQEGKVIQTVFVTSHLRTTFTAANTGNGTNLTTQLNLTITPRRSDSTIWLRWVIFYEVNHDTVFLVQRDSNLIGFNTDHGNSRWSGIVTPKYDGDYGSTPQTNTINWFDPAGSTAARTYSICIRSSGTGNHTFALNRSVGSTGQDDHEVGVSHGIAREICG